MTEGASPPPPPGGTGPSPQAGTPPPGRGIVALARDLVAFDRRALLILLYVPLAMVVHEYVFVPESASGRKTPDWAHHAVATLGRLVPADRAGLIPLLWWAAGCLLLYVVMPLVLLRVAAKTGPRALGWRLKGTGRDALTYGLLLVLFLPVVWAISGRADFQKTYPFYKPPPGPLGWDLVAFEVGYCVQFLGIETLFRGVMVLGLKPLLGRASILVMLAPYCMLHFHKPMLEAFGAIGAGLVLGSLAWRTGTVLYGWFLHYAIALSMDLLSLHQAGRL